MKAYRDIGESRIVITQEYPNEATIIDFYVDSEKRGHHVATRLMLATCKDADREGVTLYLEPLPFGSYNTDTEEFFPPSLTYKELCAFYRHFGFRFMPHQTMMKRLPK